MKKKYRWIIRAVSAFVVYLLLVWILRYFSNQLPVEDGFLGIYKNTDYFLGVVVAILLTFSQKRIQK
jgi:hypothetical protein